MRRMINLSSGGSYVCMMGLWLCWIGLWMVTVTVLKWKLVCIRCQSWVHCCNGFGNGDTLESVEKFCYLDDMLNADGGVDSVVSARVRCAWKKFRELSSILTFKEAFDMKGYGGWPSKCGCSGPSCLEEDCGGYKIKWCMCVWMWRKFVTPIWNEVNSIAWLYRDWPRHEIVSVTLHGSSSLISGLTRCG